MIVKWSKLNNYSLNRHQTAIFIFLEMLVFTTKLIIKFRIKILAVGDIDGYIYNSNGLNTLILEEIFAKGEIKFL